MTRAWRVRRVVVVSRHDPLAPRPQPIQVLRAAAGLAAAGAEVALVMDAPAAAPPSRGHIEAHLGHALGPGLTLHLAHGRHPGARGLRRRALLLRLTREPGIAVLTRDLAVLRQLHRLRRLTGRDLRLALEWHALPSLLGERDEGERDGAALADAHVFVSAGLAARVRERFGVRGPRLVAPNACQPAGEGVAERRLAELDQATGVVSAGLARPSADRDVLDALARRLPPGLTLHAVGPGSGGAGALSPAEADRRLDGALCQLALYRDDLNTREFASPLKVAQAAATGVPLVASDLPSVRALVDPDRTALLVPPGDAGAVAEAVAALADDRARAARLARRALEGSAERTWAARGARVLAMLEAT